MASDAVDYDPGDPDLAYVGMGGGLVAMNVSNDLDPHPWDTSDVPPVGNNDPMLRTFGFVYDVKRVPDPSALADKIFVAAGRAGLLRFSRTPSILTQPDYRVDPFQQANELAYALDVVDVPGGPSPGRYVILGTRTALDDGGAVYVVRDSTGLAVAQEVLGTPVLGVAASYNASTGNITVLVGTACQGLQRYDFTTTGASPTWPPTQPGSLGQGLTAQFPSPGSCQTPPCGPIWREVVIDPVNQHAYAAAFKDGVFAFDLSAGLSLVSGWPYTQPGIYAHSVDFDPVGGYLVAGLGPAYSKERQHLGTCEKPVPCYSADPVQDADASRAGLRLFHPGTAGSQPVAIWSGLNVSEFLVRDVAIRRLSSGSYRFYLASGTRGFEVISATQSGGGWTFQLQGTWGEGDVVAAGSADDLRFNSDRSVLYAGTEAKLVAFDMAVPVAQLLDQPSDVESGSGAVFIDYVDHAGFKLVLGKGQTHISVFDVATRLNPVFTHAIPAKGRGLFFQVVQNGLNPSGDPWVYWVNYNEDVDLIGTPWEVNGSVRAERLTGPSPCGTACEMGRWLDTGVLAYPSGPILRRLDGIAVRDDLGGEHAIYVNFSPREAGNPNIGLLTLKAQWNASTGMADVSLQSAIVAKSNVPTAPAGRVTWDAANNRVYAAYGCNGLAMYEMSGAYSATPHHRPLPGVPLQVVPATMGSDRFIYVTTLNKGIALIKVNTSSDFVNSTPIWFDTPHQANAVVVDPFDPMLLHLADGAGGVHRVVLQ